MEEQLIVAQVQLHSTVRRSYTTRHTDDCRLVATAILAGQPLYLTVVFLRSAGWHTFITQDVEKIKVR